MEIFSILGHSWWFSKESICNAGDTGSIPELGKLSGEGNGNSPQYSCLGNPTDREAQRKIVHRVSKSSLLLALSHFKRVFLKGLTHFTFLTTSMVWLNCVIEVEQESGKVTSRRDRSGFTLR